MVGYPIELASLNVRITALNANSASDRLEVICNRLGRFGSRGGTDLAKAAAE